MARIAVALLVTLLLAASLAPADRPAAWDFRTRPAQAARKRYEEAAARAEQEFSKKIATASETAIKELTEAMKTATRAADLEEANRISAAIDELKVSDPSPASAPSIVGGWRVTYTTGNVRQYRIDPDGSLSWTSDAVQGVVHGRVQRAGKEVLIDDGKGAVERLTLAGERLFVEHFFPAERFPNNPPRIMAVGTRARPAR